MTNSIATLDRAAFVTALTTANRTTEKRNMIPILANVLVRGEGDCVTIRSTDLDCETTVRVAGASASAPFAFTVPGHKALDVLKKAKSSLDLSLALLGDDRLQLTLAGGLRIAMDTLPVIDFPSVATGEIKHSFELATADLLGALQRVEFAMSNEETRYYLQGVYMVAERKALRFVTTDGHRLAQHEIDLPDAAANAPGVIVPSKTVKDLIALCKAKSAPRTVKVEHVDAKPFPKRLRFTIGDAELLTKTIDGSFPDYQRVIPQGNPNVLTLPRADIIAALQEVSCVSSERGRAVKMSMNGNTTFAVINPDLGTAQKTLPYEIAGKQMEIGFNAQYLAGILDHVLGDEVEMFFGTSGSPTLIKGTDASDRNALFVLMPMRV